MSADNYIAIVQGRDGKFRGYMCFASGGGPGAQEFEVDTLEQAVLAAQNIRTEYGYEVSFWPRQKEAFSEQEDVT